MSRRAKAWLVAALVAVVGMAFRVSWNALKDVATAVGADPAAATLYPVVVDGLMALALVAALVLPKDDRRFALRVLAGYTVASLALNYVHGLVPELHKLADGQRVALADWSPAHWALVLLATSLPVGSIFFGSDLVAKVLHYRPESTPTEAARSGAEQQELPTPAPVATAPESTPTPPVVAPDPQPIAQPESAPTETPNPAPKSARPRRATGTVPPAARANRPPRRTAEQLLAEARELPTEAQQSAEQIRLALRVGLPRARELRDQLAAEHRAPAVPLHAVPETDENPVPAVSGGAR